MPHSTEDLLSFLTSLGIRTSTVRHPPLFTVEESQALRGEIPGAHTKNLFVKDKKGSYFLITLKEDDTVDLKTVDKAIGASGRVSFGRPDALMDLLGVVPGAVTPFGLINDTGARVNFVLDSRLAASDTINAHPLTNEATTTIARDDLVRFIEATGHSVAILKLPS